MKCIRDEVDLIISYDHELSYMQDYYDRIYVKFVSKLFECEWVALHLLEPF